MLKSILLAIALLLAPGPLALAAPSTAVPDDTVVLEQCLTTPQVVAEFLKKVPGATFAAGSANPDHINEVYQVMLLAYGDVPEAADAYVSIQANWGEPKELLMFTVNSTAILIPLYEGACRPTFVWSIPMPVFMEYHKKWQNQQANGG